jgi:hypothetical protein
MRLKKINALIKDNSFKSNQTIILQVVEKVALAYPSEWQMPLILKMVIDRTRIKEPLYNGF